MAKRTKKRGLPAKLEQEADEAEARKSEPTLEQFVQQMHGQMDRPQNGMPDLDWLKSQYKTKSAIIRYLFNMGHTVSAIHKHTGIKYQMVRNVATTPLKRGPNEDWRPKEEPNTITDRDVSGRDEPN